LRRHRFAADNPGFLLWLVTVLGAALTGGGTVSLGRRLVDARADIAASVDQTYPEFPF